MYEIVFSPTGGTKKVADLLCGGIAENCRIVDLCDRKMEQENRTFTAEDICLFAVPCFGGRVPDLAAQRIRRMKGNHAKAILVVVIGNRAYDDALIELKDLAEEAGFVPVAAVCGNAEHSIMRQFGSGRPDAQDVKELNTYASRIKELLRQESFGELQVPGNRPYKNYSGLPMKPSASSQCTKCGKCAKECPAGAIEEEHPDTTDKDKCITCMRCVAVCPTGARALNKVMLSAAGVAMKKACSGRKKNELYLAK